MARRLDGVEDELGQRPCLLMGASVRRIDFKPLVLATAPHQVFTSPNLFTSTVMPGTSSHHLHWLDKSAFLMPATSSATRNPTSSASTPLYSHSSWPS